MWNHIIIVRYRFGWVSVLKGKTRVYEREIWIIKFIKIEVSLLLGNFKLRPKALINFYLGLGLKQKVES